MRKLTAEETKMLRDTEGPISVSALEIMQNVKNGNQLLDLLLNRAARPRVFRPEPRRPFLELD